MLPAAAPQIFAGMRTSLSLALILMVISEMVACTNGIGYFVLQSQRSFAIPEMWSGILLLGHPRLRSQRPLHAGRAARAALAPRRPRERAELMLARRTSEEELRRSAAVEAIGDVSFEVAEGEFVCVVGPVGLRQDDAAEVHQRAARADGGRRSRRGRPTSMALVFQEYSRSLFPWMTVRQNVAFPLRRKKMDKARGARDRRADARARSASSDASTATRGSSPAACSSAWRSPARSPTSRRSC